MPPVDPSHVQVHLWGAASDPLVHPVCSVDWDLTLTIDISTAQPTFTLTGKHDQWPAFELYINGKGIYQYPQNIQPSHIPTTQEVLSLCRPLSWFGVIVNASDNIPT